MAAMHQLEAQDCGLAFWDCGIANGTNGGLDLAPSLWYNGCGLRHRRTGQALAQRGRPARSQAGMP